MNIFVKRSGVTTLLKKIVAYATIAALRADDCEAPDQIKEQAVVEFSRELAGQLTARN